MQDVEADNQDERGGSDSDKSFHYSPKKEDDEKWSSTNKNLQKILQ